MARRLDGKRAIVTAAGQGIGRATALAFAREGARVAVCDINAANGQATAEAIRSEGAEAIFVAGDMTSGENVAALVETTVDSFGGVDVAANIVGGVTGGHVPDLHELSEDDWDETVALCLRSCFLCMKHELRHMVGSGGGAIINVVSSAGVRVVDSTASYSAAKAAVAHLTRVTAVRYGDRGIRINAISPGITLTPVVAERLVGGRMEASLDGHAIKRPAEAQEQAEAIVWLASDATAMVSGVILAVDGGWQAR